MALCCGEVSESLSELNMSYLKPCSQTYGITMHNTAQATGYQGQASQGTNNYQHGINRAVGDTVPVYLGKY